MLTSCAVFGIDALRLTQAKVDGFTSVTQSALLAALLTLLCTLLGWGVSALVHSTLVERLTTQVDRKPLLAAGFGLALLSYGAYGVMLLTDHYLVALGTRAMATAWLIVPLGAASYAVAHTLRTRHDPWLSWQRWQSFSAQLPLQASAAAKGAAALTLAAAAWLASFFWFEPEVFEGLAGEEWAPLVLIGLCAVLCALLLPPRRWLQWAAGLTCAAVLAVGSLAPLRPPSTRVSNDIEQASRAGRQARALLEWLLPGAENQGKSDFTASCRAGVPITPLKAVGKAKRDAPDIVLFMADGIRFDHTQLGGYRKRTTPNLKELAKRGYVFNRAYSTSASTRQTFRSLFTGLLPSQIPPSSGKNKWAVTFPDGLPTLSEYLQASGYQTRSIQSSAVFLDTDRSSQRGFDKLDHTPREAWKQLGYSAPFHTDHTIAELSAEVDRPPMFVFSHIMETHQPFVAGPGAKRFGGPGKQTRAERYDSALHFVDQELGRMIRYVLSPARTRPTILIIASDHGMGLGDRGNMGQHGNSLFDDQVHVPLLFFGHGIQPGSSDAAVSLLDLVPTALDLAGLQPAAHVCGGSLKPALSGRSKFQERPVFVEIFPDVRNANFKLAYIGGGHKLMIDARRKKLQLFNLRRDAQEQKDLSEQAPDLLKRYVQTAGKHLTEYGRERQDYGL